MLFRVQGFRLSALGFGDGVYAYRELGVWGLRAWGAAVECLATESCRVLRVVAISCQRQLRSVIRKTKKSRACNGPSTLNGPRPFGAQVSRPLRFEV